MDLFFIFIFFGLSMDGLMDG